MATIKKNTWIWLSFYLVVFGLLSLLLVQVLWPVYQSPHSRLWSSNMGYPALMRSLGEPIPVETTTVGTRDMMRSITGTVKITYLNQIPVNIEESGLVTNLIAKKGDFVKKGQILLEIDTGGFEARIAQLDFEQHRLKLNQASKNYEREREAYEKGLASLSDVEKYKQAYDEANIALEIAVEQYEKITESSSRSVLKMKEFSDGEEMVEIVSPASGVLTSQSVFYGENIIGPRNRIMTIGDQLVLQASFDQSYFSDIQIGTKAKFYLSAHQGNEFTAQVTRVDPKIITKREARHLNLPPQTFTTWLTIDIDPSASPSIAEGMDGYTVIEFSEHTTALPERALMRFSGKKGLVLTVDDEQRIKVTSIEYGTSSDGWVNIVSGLTKDDTVVLSGQTGLIAGDLVTIP